MKKLFFGLCGTLLLMACEGSTGPAGPTGPQGPYIVGSVFEIADVDFNPGNEYSFLGYFSDYVPANVEIYSSDVVLIYLNEGLVNGNDIWSLMPQTFYLAGGGTFQYNYNQSVNDFEIYLQGNVNLDALPASYTQNQIFRIAILPADFATGGKVNIENYDSVISALKTQNPDFKIFQLKK